MSWEERGQPVTWAARGAAPLEKGLFSVTDWSNLKIKNM